MPRWFLPLMLCAASVLAGCGGGGRDSARTSSTPNPTEELKVSASEWLTDFSRHTVPLSEFESGGPGKDGIPSIDNPMFTNVSGTTYLGPREPVIELVVNGEARAYPIQILIWHEIVNDELGSVPVAVTFCPLCNTALAFDRRAQGRELDFGTTGNLRNSDLVMYDRQSESWWQQFGGVAVVGRYAGTRLRQVPARIVAWSVFARRHPDGTVLARPLAHPTSQAELFLRPYGENPYPGYDDVSSPTVFPAEHADDTRLPAKERVVYVEVGSEAIAVPLSVLERREEMTVDVSGHELTVRLLGRVSSPLDSPDIGAGRSIATAEVTENGRPVPFDQPFWFAVAAFRQDVRVVR